MVCCSPLGSPPQVRGKHFGLDGRGRVGRITPAGAGKTIMLAPVPHIHQDHPRRCGENYNPNFKIYFILGSPPQVRGKRNTVFQRFQSERITPAGAGKTDKYRSAHVNIWDHPRRCGENCTVCSCLTGLPGSPPQVRGKRGEVDVVMYNEEDHPRRCGENFWISSIDVPILGSPPQVRGKRGFDQAALMTGRITPAGAGKTGI